MKIQNIKIQNFRGYKQLEVELNSNFNLFIGDNGSGKTAILEALTVAIGSLFLGIKGINSRGIHKKDIRIATFEYSQEYQFPVTIQASGIVNNQSIHWNRTLSGYKNKTTNKDANAIKDLASEMDTIIRGGENINLPLLAYYATGRLFNVGKDNTEEFSVDKKEKMLIASRFRAYNKSLAAKSTYKQFQRWFRGKELSRIQKGRDDINFEIVKEAIIENLPNCVNVFYEFDPDKPKGLMVELEDGRVLPFNSLSDGTRNFFAIIADMAYMCTTLNPHLEKKVLKETEGVVLIDELDLHLHPEWQRKLIKVLKDTFPKIQFIATTHSPFLIQETGQEQLFVLKDSKIHKITSAVNLSIEDIAEELQYVKNPQWSKSRQKMFEKAKQYYQAVKEGKDTAEMKTEFDIAMKPFALDTAYYAIIEQERIIQNYNKSKNETRK